MQHFKLHFRACLIALLAAFLPLSAALASVEKPIKTEAPEHITSLKLFDNGNGNLEIQWEASNEGPYLVTVVDLGTNATVFFTVSFGNTANVNLPSGMYEVTVSDPYNALTDVIKLQ